MSLLAALSASFRFNEKALETATGGFSRSDWLHRAEGRGSHALWILGHLGVSRRTIAKALGAERPEASWLALFGRGSQPLASAAAYPDPATLKEDFRASGDAIESHLASITPEGASAPYSRRLPDGTTTIEGAARFYLWHETYHLGQIGLLRRACGKGGIA